MKKNEKISGLIANYKGILTHLKEKGCLLNTIMPEFLLSCSDYNHYVKSQDITICEVQYKRLNEKRHRYISVDAWVTLYFQIVKVFYMSRINIPTFPHICRLDKDDYKIPEYCLENKNGNLFSHNENLLMFWME